METECRAVARSEAYGEWNKKKEFTPPVFEKSEEAKARLAETLGKSFMFGALPKAEMAIITGAMEEVEAKESDKLISKGDEGDFLFVISCDIF